MFCFYSTEVYKQICIWFPTRAFLPELQCAKTWYKTIRVNISSNTLTRSHTATLLLMSKVIKMMPYHFSHWSSIQPSPPSLPESIPCLRRASTARRGEGWQGARLEREGGRERRRSEQEESWGKGRRGTARPGQWARSPIQSMAAAARPEEREMDGPIVLMLWSWSCQNGVVLYNLPCAVCVRFTMPPQKTASVSRSKTGTESPNKKKKKHQCKRKRPSLAFSQWK